MYIGISVALSLASESRMFFSKHSRDCYGIFILSDR